MFDALAKRTLSKTMTAARNAGLALSVAELDKRRLDGQSTADMPAALVAVATAIEPWFETEAAREVREHLWTAVNGPYQTWPPLLTVEQRSAIDLYMLANREQLNNLYAAARLQPGPYPLHWGPSALETRFSFLTRHRIAADSLRTATIYAVEQGHLATARKRLEDTFAINACLGQESLVLPVVMSLHHERQAIYALEYVLSRGVFGNETLEALRAHLDVLPERRRLKDIVTGVYSNEYDTVCVFASGRTVFAQREFDGCSVSEALRTFYRKCPGWMEYDFAALLRRWTAESEKWNLPAREILKWSAERAAEAYPLGERSPAGLVAKLTYWQMDVTLTRLFATEALAVAADTALAAEQYRLVEGSWPGELVDLVPRFLDTVLLDPFTNESLRYSRTDDGVTVWSVGRDKVDDGGALLPGPDGQVVPDIGFRLLNPSLRQRVPATQAIHEVDED